MQSKKRLADAERFSTLMPMPPEESLERSVIVVPYMFDLVRSARLLQAQEFLQLGLGLRAVRFRRGHQQYRQRHRGIRDKKGRRLPPEGRTGRGKSAARPCPTAIWSHRAEPPKRNRLRMPWPAVSLQPRAGAAAVALPLTPNNRASSLILFLPSVGQFAADTQTVE